MAFIGDTPPDPAAATMLRFAGNCTTNVLVTKLDADHIELELRLTPRRLPHEGSLTINCRWERRGLALTDERCVDLTRSSTPPMVSQGALVAALLDALGLSDTDIDDDEALRATLHNAIVTVRVRLIAVTAMIAGADNGGALRPRGHRLQYVPLIVRFLPVLQ